MTKPLNINTSNGFALDTKGIGELRQAAKENSPEALKATTQQFEALFVNMMLKSMRDASPQDGMFDSQQSRMYTSMLDQQLSQSMASKGVGLAEVLTRQLASFSNAPSTPASETEDGIFKSIQQAIEQQPLSNAKDQFKPAPTGSASPANPVQPFANSANSASAANPSQPAHVRNFQQKLEAHAEEASRVTGIPAKFMLGQAALESGWGRREIVGADGARSHNLFGIKAGSNWKGKVVETATTEYVNGVPQTRIEKFRAYGSYAESFRDYANLLKNNPRYDNVIANSKDALSFAQGLQKAGYATDPHYATKLAKIIKNSLSA